jgi:hypothetical protein
MTLETGGKSFDKAKDSSPRQEEAVKGLIVSKDKVKERSKRQREANNKNEDVVWAYDEHELGKWEITDEKRVQDQAIKKGLDSRAIGGVDATSFDSRKVDQAMMMKMTNWADKFANLFVDGKIVSNFSTLNSVKTQGDMLNIIGEIAELSYKAKHKDFKFEDFKKKLESGRDRNLIYGPQGALNILLAIHRADEAIKGKDVGKYIYDIRVGKKKLSQSERFSELRQSRVGKGPGEASIVDAKIEHAKGFRQADEALTTFKTEFENKYGATVEMESASVGSSENLVTMKVTSAEGISRTFYFRSKVDGANVVYSLSKVSLRGEAIYSSAGEALGAFKAKLEDFFSKSKAGKEREDISGKANAEVVEKVSQTEFVQNLNEFFTGGYLKEFYPKVAYSTKAHGVYAGGVEVNGASYVLHIENDNYFVFPNAETRDVELKIVSEVSTNKFALVSLGNLYAGDLKTKTDKSNFALNVYQRISAANKVEKK